MVTDPDRVRELGKAKAEENRQFREALRRSQIPGAELDAAVARLFWRVSPRVDCTRCANCCRDLAPTLGSRDVARLARGAGVTPASFRRGHLVSDRDPDRFVFKRKPCPMLAGRLCGRYADRPQACRSFPEFDKPGFLHRSVFLLYNLPYCPIIYNVFELLKRDFAGRVEPGS